MHTVDEHSDFSLLLSGEDIDGPSSPTYSVSGGPDEALFRIDQNSNLIMTAKDFEEPLDKDGNNTYEVDVTITDGIDSSTKSFLITVTDIDDSPPRIESITMLDSYLRVGETSVVEIVFTEAVQNFDVNDVSVSNGTILGDFTPTDETLTVWTATFQPYDDVYAPENVIEVSGQYYDLAENLGSGGSSENYVVDTLTPTCSVDLLTLPSLKLEFAVPPDFYTPVIPQGATDASPSAQSAVETFEGTENNDIIGNNGAFSQDLTQSTWVKNLHVDFNNFEQISEVVIRTTTEIDNIPGFQFKTGNPDVTLSQTDSYEWVLSPTAPFVMSDGLDLHLAYNVTDVDHVAEFKVEFTVIGSVGSDTHVATDSLYLVWKEALDEADFTLPDKADGTPVAVLPRDGVGVIVDSQAGDDTVYAGAGHDLVYGGTGSDSLYGGLGDDLLEGMSDNDELYGGEGNDLLNGGDGADILDGGSGTDTASYQGDASSGITASLQTGFVGINGQAEGDTYFSIENLIGGQGNDFLFGDENPLGTNVLSGGKGQDQLNGLAGNDILLGGENDDTLLGGEGADFLDGGEHESYGDTASYVGDEVGVIASLESPSFIGKGGQAEGDTYVNIENLTGGSGDDQLTGSSFNNILKGEEGEDTLIGGAGADVLDGGDHDSEGDTASYVGDVDGVTVSLETPGEIGLGGHAQGDTYVGIENLVGGDGADTLTGNSSANKLIGGLDDDLLIGGIGADTLDGGDHGSSGDTASYSNASSGIIASLDEALLGLQDDFGGDASGDRYIDIENLTGSDFKDNLYGNNENNTLFGGLGNDTMSGAGGDDLIYANQGSDKAYGGANNDTIHVSTLFADLPDLIDGGEDDGQSGDTLVLEDLDSMVHSGSYSLSPLAQVTKNIETLDIQDGFNTVLSLTSSDIQTMVQDPSGQGLTILADQGDSLVVSLSSEEIMTPVAFDPDLESTTYTILNGSDEVALIHWSVA